MKPELLNPPIAVSFEENNHRLLASAVRAAIAAAVAEARRDERKRVAEKVRHRKAEGCNCAAVDIGVGIQHEPGCGEAPEWYEMADWIEALPDASGGGFGSVICMTCGTHRLRLGDPCPTCFGRRSP